jgi:hypothetical protein
MFRKPNSLSKQLVLATVLALGASSVALAEDSSMNPSTRGVDSGQNRGNLNMMAQSPCPQGTESTGALQKKGEQKIESTAVRANRWSPSQGPFDHNYYNQWPGQ